MTYADKLSMIKTLLEIDDNDHSEDKRITVYLTIAEKEILSWGYSYAKNPPTEVPPEYEMTQINAVVTGYGMIGSENQTSDKEGVIFRVFKYEDMIAYIRGHVIPIARCV